MLAISQVGVDRKGECSFNNATRVFSWINPYSHLRHCPGVGENIAAFLLLNLGTILVIKHSFINLRPRDSHFSPCGFLNFFMYTLVKNLKAAKNVLELAFQ